MEVLTIEQELEHARGRIHILEQHIASIERTCTMTYDEEWSGDELYPTEAFICSECGGMTVEGVPKFCPNCGARVEGVNNEA